MRTRHFVLLLAVLLTLQSAPLWAQTTGTLVVTTSIALTQNHNGNIVIAADRDPAGNPIQLNCRNHIVTGNDSGRGITLVGRTGVTIENCQVRNFVMGVFLDASHRNFFRNNTVFNNRAEGFRLERSDANVFIQNVVGANDRDGFDLGDSNKNVFDNNSVERNKHNGIELDRSSFNVFRNNTASGNGSIEQGENVGHGFSLDASDANVFIQNTANGNREKGFRIATDDQGDGSDDNTLINNRACENGEENFDVARGSFQNWLINNRSCDFVIPPVFVRLP